MSDHIERILFNLAPGAPQEFKYFKPPTENAGGKEVLWKEAMMVEEGVFNKHPVTPERIQEFERNFSRRLPMQVNHDKDPYKTVGRLWEVKALQEDGQWKLFGLFKVIDPDAQERILDGRWMELSIAFYFKPEYRLYECSIVTDPACVTAHIFKKEKEVSPMPDDIDKDKEKETPPAAEAPTDDEMEKDEETETPASAPHQDPPLPEMDDEEELSQDDEVSRLKAELAAKNEELAKTSAQLAEAEVDKALERLGAKRYITPAQMPVAREICLAMAPELRAKMFSFIELGMAQWQEGRLSSDEVKPTAAGSSEDADYQKIAAAREKRLSKQTKRRKTTS